MKEKLQPALFLSSLPVMFTVIHLTSASAWAQGGRGSPLVDLDQLTTQVSDLETEVSDLGDNISALEAAVSFLESVVTSSQQATYAIGDIGPAGGWVFHVTDGGLHGLEAASTIQGGPLLNLRWGCLGQLVIPGASNLAEWVGMGATNTADILRHCDETNLAAAIAASYVSPSGHYDWFLPSKDELELMGQNLAGTDDRPYICHLHWSSSEFNARQAWAVIPCSGAATIESKVLPGFYFVVRAIREF